MLDAFAVVWSVLLFLLDHLKCVPILCVNVVQTIIIIQMFSFLLK